MARELDKIEIHNSKVTYLYNPYCFKEKLDCDYLDKYFSVEKYKDDNAVLKIFKGRGNTYLVKDCRKQNVVIRHYWRGGFFGKILKDNFLKFFSSNQRAFREYDMLIVMRKMGFPVPRPVAAKMTKSALFMKNDIILEEIHGAQDLSALLCQRSLTTEEICKIGYVLGTMFSAGIYHCDLNIKNIMIDSATNPWIIDFDKCVLKKVDQKTYNKMVERLIRSFNKELLLRPSLQWTTLNKELLLEAMDKAYKKGEILEN